METPEKNIYIVDGVAVPTAEREIFSRLTTPYIYEVLRVVDGVPLFFSDHLDRLRQSAALSRLPDEIAEERLVRDISHLIEANDVRNQNVKILYGKADTGETSTVVFLNKSFYPPDAYYEEGVFVVSERISRDNPHAKVHRDEYKKKVEAVLERTGAFEVILLDEEGRATEGSRSNLFFLRDREVVTSPPGKVLLGITRKVIVEMIEELKIPIVYETLSQEDLGTVEGAFLSGTSIDLLPISRYDDRRFSTPQNRIYMKLHQSYRERVEKDLKEFSSKF
jgi:branched-chain amino acid aminotransferase